MFNLSAFMVYIFVTAYTPGPNNIMSMSNAVRFGFKRSFRFNLGIWAGFSLVMLICTLLSSVLFQFIPKVKIAMLLIGAGYILYLAWKTFKSDPEIKAEETKGASFISGALLQFINPKIYFYAITSMSVYILPAYSDSIPALIGFALFLAFFGFTATIAWSLFGSAFCKLLVKHARLVNTAMALLLVYCAVSLFL
jgi:threonine/homoserine/homoserine lactone efflux protein